MPLLLDANQLGTEYLKSTDAYVKTVGAADSTTVISTTDGVASLEVFYTPDPTILPLFYNEYFTVSTQPANDGRAPTGTVWDDDYTASFPTGITGTYDYFTYKKYGTTTAYYQPEELYKTKTRRVKLTLITFQNGSSTYKIGIAFRGQTDVPNNPYLIYTDTLTPVVRGDGWYEFSVIYDMNVVATDGIMSNIFIKQPNTKSAFKILSVEILEDL